MFLRISIKKLIITRYDYIQSPLYLFRTTIQLINNLCTLSNKTFIDNIRSIWILDSIFYYLLRFHKVYIISNRFIN